MNKILILLLFVSNAVFGQVNLTLGLRAYYPFSGNANDISGNNNNPFFNNATLTADRTGASNSAYHFNGTNTYMRILNNPTLNMVNTISISLWVKPMGYYTGTCHNNMLVSKQTADFLPGNYSVRYTPHPLTGCVPAPNYAQSVFYGVNRIATTPFIELDKWYSVVWTSDGTTSRIYINCQLMNSGPDGGLTFTNAEDVFFGKMNNVTYPFWFNGDLDEIRIYDRALTQDEVDVLGDCSTLPLRFVDVNVNKIANANQVTWKVAEETGCKEYQVQRSTDAENWNNTGTPLLPRNDGGIQSYTYADNATTSPITYYRIKQISLDGKIVYSSIVFVKNKEEGILSIHPNPAVNSLFISASNSGSRIRSLQVYSLTGQQIMMVPLNDVKQYSLDISSIPSASYLLQAEMTNGSFERRLFIKR